MSYDKNFLKPLWVSAKTCVFALLRLKYGEVKNPCKQVFNFLYYYICEKRKSQRKNAPRFYGAGRKVCNYLGVKPFGKCDIKLLFNVDYKFAVYLVHYQNVVRF